MKYCLRGTRQLYDVSEGHERISAALFHSLLSLSSLSSLSASRRSRFHCRCRCRCRTDHRRLLLSLLAEVSSLGLVFVRSIAEPCLVLLKRATPLLLFTARSPTGRGMNLPRVNPSRRNDAPNPNLTRIAIFPQF